MSRQTVFVAVCSTAALFSMVLVAVLFLGGKHSKTSPDLTYALQALDARLDQMDSRWHSRIADLEENARFASTGAGGLPRFSDEGDAEGEREPGEDDNTENLSPEEQLQRMLARLDDFDTRIRGLEEDPIERGYNFLQSQNPELRRQGILALERIANSDPEARATIRQMLQDSDTRVRLTALDTLADIGDKESVASIMPLLSDENSGVRRETIETLARLGAQQAGEQISSMLKDPDMKVRERAADVLGRIKYQGGGDYLLSALTDENGEVRGQAIASLGEIGYKNAIPALREMYNKDPGRERYRLVQALKNLGDTQPLKQEVSRMSKTALNDENERSRRDAIRTLSWFARNESKAVFTQALEDPSERVRSEAQRALGGDRGGDRGGSYRGRR